MAGPNQWTSRIAICLQHAGLPPTVTLADGPAQMSAGSPFETNTGRNLVSWAHGFKHIAMGSALTDLNIKGLGARRS